MSDLPKGWIEIPLKDCVYFQEGPGLRKWQFGESGIPFLNIRTLSNGRIDKSKCQFVKVEEFTNKYEHFLLNEGDIIVSSSGTIGKLAVVRSEDLPLMLNTSVIRYRTLYSENLTQSFLKNYLQSQHFFKQISASKTGSAIENYGPSHLKEMKIVVPPLNEQKRIVEKLEKLLGKIEDVQARLDKIPAILKRFRQAVLAAACSGKLTADWRLENIQSTQITTPSLIADEELLFEIPSNWCWVRLGSEASFINGDRGTNYPNRAEYVPAGIPFINTGHIQPDGSLNAERMHHLTREKFNSLRGGKIQKGDLVYCLRGATLGKTAMVEPYTEGAIASSLVIIRPKDNIDQKYAYYFLVSTYTRELIERFENGSAQPNLGADSVKQFIIPLPPLEEQKEIVRRVEDLFKFADQIEARYKKARSYTNKLTQSILAKAFRGELVPQDENDEPASLLLERIKAARGETELQTTNTKQPKAKTKNAVQK